MSELAARVILGLVIAGIVCAAMYAIFARPSTDEGKKRRREITNGFRLAGGIVLGILLMTGFVFGAHIALFGGSPRVSRSVAAMIAAVSFGFIALTVQRWARYFAGWVAYGILNSITMALSGHVLNNPSVPVARWYALATAAVYVASVLPTMRFANGERLHVADKVALLIWVVAFTGVLLFPKAGLPIIGAGAAALVIAWWLHRSSRHRHGHTPELKQRSTTPTIA